MSIKFQIENKDTLLGYNNTYYVGCLKGKINGRFKKVALQFTKHEIECAYKRANKHKIIEKLLKKHGE